MKPDLLTFVLCALGAFRITRLIVKDEITNLLRDWLKNHAFKTMIRRDTGETRQEIRGSNNVFTWLWTLFTCSWCMGVWVSTAIVLIAVDNTGIAAFVWIAACAGVVGIIGEFT